MGFKKGNKVGNRFSADNQPQKNGRKPKDAALARALESCGFTPTQEQINQILAATLVKDAESLAADAKDKGMAMILRIASKEVLGSRGWLAVKDILDRIHGKPKQQQDITTNGRDIGTAPTFDNTIMLFPDESDDE